MEAMYEKDLTKATEVVLNWRRRVRPAGDVLSRRTRGGGGSAGRAAAGALRLGNALGSALSPRRIHGDAERRLLLGGGFSLLALALLGLLWPKVLAWPLGAFCLWLGSALVFRASKGRKPTSPPVRTGAPPAL